MTPALASAVMPLLRGLDAERAHVLALAVLRASSVSSAPLRRVVDAIDARDGSRRSTDRQPLPGKG